jgi:thioredoxin
MKALLSLLAACCLAAAAGCGPAGGGGGESAAAPAGEPAAAKQEPAAEKPPAEKPPAAEEPEEPENAEASKESVVKVKRLLRRWTSNVAEERAEAWEGLKDMGDLATPALIEVIKTGKPEERRFAITAVGLLGDKLGAEAIRAALADQDAAVRWCAARALGEIGDAEAKPLLARALANDKDPEVRYHAAYALAALGGAEAFEYFRKELSSESVEGRSRAVRALGKYGGAKHVGDLIGAMNDTDARVRQAAIIQLDRSRSKEAVPGMIAALEDQDYRVRKRARSALERLTGKDFGRDRGKWEEWWKKNGEKFKPRTGPAGSEPIEFENAEALKGAEDFKKKVAASKGLVLVNFYTNRSKDCHTYAPVFDKLAAELKDKAKLYAAEAKANMATIRDLKLRSAPSTVVFKDGKQVEIVTGHKEEEALRKIVEEHLAGTRVVPAPAGKTSFPDAADAADFGKRVLEAELPVLVDFHADWCKPCQRLAPVLEELCKEFEGKVGFVGVDTDKLKELMEKYEVTALPTMVLFKGGKEVERLRGFKPEAEIRAVIEKVLDAGGGEAGK